MTAPIPPFPVAALAGIWLAGQRGGGDERTEHGMSWDGRHPNCVCTKSMGDSADCQMHAAVYRQRQAGCSCWAGWEMPDGTRADPYCDADEWHNREADYA